MPELVKLTVPVGAVWLAEVSVTIAVQVDAEPQCTALGVQLTVILVDCSSAGFVTPTAIPTGVVPTFTVATTVFVLPLMTETVPETVLAT